MKFGLCLLVSLALLGLSACTNGDSSPMEPISSNSHNDSIVSMSQQSSAKPNESAESVLDINTVNGNEEPFYGFYTATNEADANKTTHKDDKDDENGVINEIDILLTDVRSNLYISLRTSKNGFIELREYTHGIAKWNPYVEEGLYSGFSVNLSQDEYKKYSDAIGEIHSAYKNVLDYSSKLAYADDGMRFLDVRIGETFFVAYPNHEIESASLPELDSFIESIYHLACERHEGHVDESDFKYYHYFTTDDD